MTEIVDYRVSEVYDVHAPLEVRSLFLLFPVHFRLFIVGEHGGGELKKRKIAQYQSDKDDFDPIFPEKRLCSPHKTKLNEFPSIQNHTGKK